MAVGEKVVTDEYAIYNDDCMNVLASMPSEKVGLSVYSPPFAGLYHYSSDERDLSNSSSRDEFFRHYGFIIDEVARVTKPGRMSAVHCADVPSGNTGMDALFDLSGEIIRLHEKRGFRYIARYCVWKEPLGVRNRTMMKSLSHRAVVQDSSRCSVANADYLVVFRRDGENIEPIVHPTGLMEYFGDRQVPPDVVRYRGWTGNQIENRYSQWVWRQYASAFWDDVRIDRVLPYRTARDEEDEKHVHPLQLDVIDRALVLWSNHGDIVLSPFMGVGSEVYSAVRAGRKAIGVELKASYYRQAVKNLEAASKDRRVQDVLPIEMASEQL